MDSSTPRVHLEQETFVRAPLDAVRVRAADLDLWRQVWPRAQHRMDDDRGPKGIRWSVAGEVVGTAEVWLQPVRAGVVVHVFLRVDPVSARGDRRLLRTYGTAARLAMFAVKDELERRSASLLAFGSEPHDASADTAHSDRPAHRPAQTGTPAQTPAPAGRRDS